MQGLDNLSGSEEDLCQAKAELASFHPHGSKKCLAESTRVKLGKSSGDNCFVPARIVD